jgi:hypothetical protein
VCTNDVTWCLAKGDTVIISNEGRINTHLAGKHHDAVLWILLEDFDNGQAKMARTACHSDGQHVRGLFVVESNEKEAR